MILTIYFFLFLFLRFCFLVSLFPPFPSVQKKALKGVKAVFVKVRAIGIREKDGRDYRHAKMKHLTRNAVVRAGRLERVLRLDLSLVTARQLAVATMPVGARA